MTFSTTSWNIGELQFLFAHRENFRVARVFNGKIPYLSAAINTSMLLKAAWFAVSRFSGLFSEMDESDSWSQMATANMGC
jgi:hypothetical protein